MISSLSDMTPTPILRAKYRCDFMAKLVIIAAVDEKYGIGINGELLCHLPSDLKHFKELTVGHSVIMGRKTFESLPNGALPNRRNIVVGSRECPGCETFPDLETALDAVRKEEKAFVIGGGMLYAAAMPLADELEITHIKHIFEADVFFPQIDEELWELAGCERHEPGDRDKYAFEFCSYRRRRADVKS